jgi:hypothetical protein
MVGTDSLQQTASIISSSVCEAECPVHVKEIGFGGVRRGISMVVAVRSSSVARRNREEAGLTAALIFIIIW